MSKSLTVKEIKEKLDELKVEYGSTLDKDDLMKLLEDAQKKEPEQPAEETKETEADKEIKTYVVIHDFKDLKDNDTIYIKDDIYPRRSGAKVDEARIQELMSKDNKIGEILIKEQD